MLPVSTSANQTREGLGYLHVLGACCNVPGVDYFVYEHDMPSDKTYDSICVLWAADSDLSLLRRRRANLKTEGTPRWTLEVNRWTERLDQGTLMNWLSVTKRRSKTLHPVWAIRSWSCCVQMGAGILVVPQGGFYIDSLAMEPRVLCTFPLGVTARATGQSDLSTSALAHLSRFSSLSQPTVWPAVVIFQWILRSR